MEILIAEDDFTSRYMLKAVLQKGGHEVLEAKNGAEAWEILREPNAPRLAILDWMMPELDGIEVCRRVRTTSTTDPQYLILLTSRDDERSIVNGLDAGANDYLTKPYKSDELRARITVGQRMLELQSDLNGAKQALAHEAAHDALTGLFNRRAILDGLTREISRAKRANACFSIGLCDIDMFKQVNDHHGHQVGDDVLKGFARFVLSKMRDYDLMGRYGGEEFLLITPEGKSEAMGELYERLRAAVSKTEIATRTGAVPITISIGVAIGTGESSTDCLLAAADAALYQAKLKGRNRVVYAHENLGEVPA